MRRYRLVLLTAVVGALVVAATTGAAMGHGLSRTASAAGVTAAAATSTAGCGKTPALASGTHSIQSSGQSRSYILRIPDSYDRNHPYRLVFAFHWLNGTANDVASGGSDGAVWSYYGLQQMSSNSTIFVAPQGINNGWANTNGQDLTLVDDLNNLLGGDLCVDTTQRFALGWSYGGAMSYALACARATVFRAVAVLSGANLSGCTGGGQPIAYLGIHGIHDSVLNISNGRSLRDAFVRTNGCSAQNPPEPAQGSLTHIVTAYSGCRSGYPVEWAAFDGDHTPDPVDGSPVSSGARTWTSSLIWKFFTQLQSTTPPTSTPPTSTPPTSTPPTSTPPTSMPPTSAPPTTPSGTGCTATYQVTNSWPDGFQANVTVANNAATTLDGWTVHFTLASGQSIASLWNGTATGTTGSVTVHNAPYNGSIVPGGNTTFGFTGNGSSTPASAVNCTSP
jgi:poly(3-hydroxybutyrate) depolymerase